MNFHFNVVQCVGRLSVSSMYFFLGSHQMKSPDRPLCVMLYQTSINFYYMYLVICLWFLCMAYNVYGSCVWMAHYVCMHAEK